MGLDVPLGDAGRLKPRRVSGLEPTRQVSALAATGRSCELLLQPLEGDAIAAARGVHCGPIPTGDVC